jgi:uracil-DNA glycosylase family 4
VTPAADERRRALDDLRREVEGCARCVLGETRTRAVFGEGDPDAELLFVGEAPGYHEDQQGRPFVGAAGKLLDELLASIGLRREQVFIANVLKSRPPNNRDPRPEEIAACQPYLWRQIELIEPLVICTLGNFATKLLSGDPAGITRVHGRPRGAVVGGRDLYLFPIFHPAAALYTPAMLTTLEEDVARLPELLAHARGDSPSPAARPATAGRPDAADVVATGSGTDDVPAFPAVAASSPAAAPVAPAPAEQLGLF